SRNTERGIETVSECSSHSSSILPNDLNVLNCWNDLNNFVLLVPQRNPHSKFPVFKIAQRLVDLIVSIRLRNETFEFDPAGRCHWEPFLDIKSLPPGAARNFYLAGDEPAAADGERAVA